MIPASHVSELIRLLDRGRPNPPEGSGDGGEDKGEEGEVAKLFREMFANLDAKTPPRADGGAFTLFVSFSQLYFKPSVAGCPRTH